MTVTVPDSFRELLDDSSRADEEVRIRLAAQFYSVGEIGLGRAASIAGMERPLFEAWLRGHGIGIPWSDADLETEIANARRLSSRVER